MQQSRNDDVVGKIFVALSQDMRQCLICDGVFTTQAEDVLLGKLILGLQADQGLARQLLLKRKEGRTAANHILHVEA
jgi:hypothetical protein